MNYFKNKKNEVFAYDDEQVNQGYGKDLTAITEEEMQELTKYIPTQEEINAQKLAEIKELEISLLRPLRELNSTLTSAEDKAYAQIKVDEIEAQIQGLRDEIQT